MKLNRTSAWTSPAYVAAEAAETPALRLVEAAELELDGRPSLDTAARHYHEALALAELVAGLEAPAAERVTQYVSWARVIAEAANNLERARLELEAALEAGGT